MAREVLGIAGAGIGFIIGGGPQGAQIGFLIGSTIGALIDGPPHFDGPKLADAQVQTSRDYVPIPIGWGICHVVGNIIQMNAMVERTKKVKQGKGGGATTTETRRYRTFGIGITRGPAGPIIGLLRVWENNKLVYDVRSGSNFPAADNTAFTNGTNLYLGTESQLPDPELEAEFGVGLTPSYRGLPYIVFVNKDITDFGSMIPQYRFEIDAGPISASLISDGTGWALSSNGHQGFPAQFREHPFQGLSLPELTHSIVLQLTRLDAGGNKHKTSSFMPGPIAHQFQIIDYNGTQFRWYITSEDTEPFHPNQQVDGVEAVFASGDYGYPLWEWNDWYSCKWSYSAALRTLSVNMVNLTRGQEFSTNRTGFGDGENIRWLETGVGDLSFHSCGWAGNRWLGPDAIIAEYWVGSLLQHYTAEKYFDFTVSANRRRFCNLDGIKRINTGLEIDGTQPLVYLPNGTVNSNTGSLFIGKEPGDFIASAPVDLSGPVPPISDT